MNSPLLSVVSFHCPNGQWKMPIWLASYTCQESMKTVTYNLKQRQVMFTVQGFFFLQRSCMSPFSNGFLPIENTSVWLRKKHERLKRQRSESTRMDWLDVVYPECIHMTSVTSNICTCWPSLFSICSPLDLWPGIFLLILTTLNKERINVEWMFAIFLLQSLSVHVSQSSVISVNL